MKKSMFLVIILLFSFWTEPFSFVQKDLLLEKIVLHNDVRNFWGIKEAEVFYGDKKFYTKYEIINFKSIGVWSRYIEPEKFSGREVIRKGQKIYSKTKKDSEFIIEKGRYPSIYFTIRKENLRLLRENYNVIPHENTNIADRECSMFEVISNSCKKPEMKIWADVQTGQIIKYEKYFNDKKILSYWFSEIKINTEIDTTIFSLNIEDSSEEKQKDTKYYYSIEALEKEVEFPIIKSQKILFGYEFYQGHIILRKNRKIAHLIYTDALNNISVFIRKQNKKDLEKYEEEEIKIRTKRSRTVISKIENDIHISLLGELDKKDMMQIFFSMGNGIK